MQNTDNTYVDQPNSLQDMSSSYLNSWSNWQQPSPPVIRQEPVPVPGSHQQTSEFSFAPMSAPSAPTLGPQPSIVSVPLERTEMESDSPGNTQLMDMGMMVSGESGMDEHWISFMRGSGLMEPSTYPPTSRANASNSMDTAFVGNGTPHDAFR